MLGLKTPQLLEGEGSGQRWIRTIEVVRQQIYSLPRLATSVSTRFPFVCGAVCKDGEETLQVRFPWFLVDGLEPTNEQADDAE